MLAEEHPGIRTIRTDLAYWTDMRKKVKGLDTMDYLVNDAGAVDIGDFMNTKKEEIDQMCNVNIKSLIKVPQVVA